MPIKITDYSGKDERGVEVAWLCDEDWELHTQMEALKEWLAGKEAAALPTGSYLVDVGFSPRDGAAGASAVLDVESMKAMTLKGIELHLSEYPPFVETK